MIIGGAEDKLGQKPVLRRFVEMAGGTQARIAVCATASSLGDEITDLYDDVFSSLGAAEVTSVRPVNRAEAQSPVALKAMQDVTGVFFTGGNQSRLANVLRGTRLGDAVGALYAGGMVVGGTSAGASVLSEHMIVLGALGDTPKHRMAQSAQGLGLLPGVIVDQHFAERGRFGRLTSLVCASPHLLGMGVDEDTAAIISDERLLSVLGRGSVFLVEADQAITNAYAARRTDPMLVSGARFHFLPAGTKFDLTARELQEFRTAVEIARVARSTSTHVSSKRASHRVDVDGVDDRRVAQSVRRRIAPTTATEGDPP